MDFVWLGIMIPIIGIVVTGVVIVFALERFYRIRRLDHEAKMLAIEKGYDVPMHRPKSNYPFAWPFILISFGLALISIYLFADGDEAALGFGLVMGFIGLGLFASRYYGAKSQDLRDREIMARQWRAPEATMPPPPAEHG